MDKMPKDIQNTLSKIAWEMETLPVLKANGWIKN